MREMTIAVLLDVVFISSRYTYQIMSVLQRQAESRFNAAYISDAGILNPRPSPLPLDDSCHSIVAICWGHCGTTPEPRELRRIGVTLEIVHPCQCRKL